jgi:hypothetical protein
MLEAAQGLWSKLPQITGQDGDLNVRGPLNLTQALIGGFFIWQGRDTNRWDVMLFGKRECE